MPQGQGGGGFGAQPQQTYRPPGLNFGGQQQQQQQPAQQQTTQRPWMQTQQPGLAGAGQQWANQNPQQAYRAQPQWQQQQTQQPQQRQQTQQPQQQGGGGSHQGQYINGQWVPTVTETTTLSPTEQKIFDQSTGLQLQAGDVTKQLLSNVPTDKMSFANAPAMPTEGGFNQSAHDAVYAQQTAQLDPQFAQAEQEMKDDLASKGIPAGSAAYNQQMDAFNRQKSYAYGQARDAAIQEGYNVANQQFNQGMAARQQGVGEAETLYKQPGNTLAQLYSAYQGGGGVQMPNAQYNPGQVSPTNVAGIAGNYQDAQNAAYGAANTRYGANVGAASNIAGDIAAYELMK